MVKVYNLCRVKTNRLAVLTVKSGLDPHMIIELENDLNRCCFIFGGVVTISNTYLWVNGINLYLVKLANKI